MTWDYDRGDHRDTHEADIPDPTALDRLLGQIHDRDEPVVVTIYDEPTDDTDDLPPGVQVGLGFATHAFIVHITDDGGYDTDPDVPAPATAISFDLGGVPTEYLAEYLRLRPETAVQKAVAFLGAGGSPVSPPPT
ncbi:hypothetical protein AB0I61_31120 [Polymorphospora rubra]|uniref:hypothetical protein n=1 Tax=Polymorphospora rubra TaxID=338584 RepID=UPI0034039141